MKKEKKILICSVLNQLAQRDPEWKKAKMVPKFKILWYRWRQIELQQKRHSAPFYSTSWKRGWLPKADFERFKEYAMQ